jgi:hypothetical protein
MYVGYPEIRARPYPLAAGPSVQAPVRRAVNVFPSVDHQKTAMKASNCLHDGCKLESWNSAVWLVNITCVCCACLCASSSSTRRRRHDGGRHAVNRATRSMDGRHAPPHRMRKHGRARSSRQVGQADILARHNVFVFSLGARWSPPPSVGAALSF